MALSFRTWPSGMPQAYRETRRTGGLLPGKTASATLPLNWPVSSGQLACRSNLSTGRCTVWLLRSAAHPEAGMGTLRAADHAGNPCAAADGPSPLRFYPDRVARGQLPVRGWTIPVGDPFLDVANQIEDAIRAGTSRVAAHGAKPKTFRVPWGIAQQHPRIGDARWPGLFGQKSHVCASGISPVAPGIPSGVGATARLFPLGFRGQTLACPRAVGMCVFPVHPTTG
jgi:hypothetical protein